MEIAEFLLARIAEDEAGDHDYWCSSSQVPDEPCDCPRKRVLAECEAKRRIVRRAALLIDSFQRTVNGWDGAAWPDVNRREKSHAWNTLYDLAEIYANHPNCKPEWDLEAAATSGQ